MNDAIREAAIHYQDGLITLGEFHLRLVRALLSDDTVTLETQSHPELEMLARHLSEM